MSCFTDYANAPETDFEFQSRDEEMARYEESRYQRTKLDPFWGAETHAYNEFDGDPDNVDPNAQGYWLPVEQSAIAPGTLLMEEAGLTAEEASALVAAITRKPVRLARMQMELFPEVA